MKQRKRQDELYTGKTKKKSSLKIKQPVVQEMEKRGNPSDTEKYDS